MSTVVLALVALPVEAAIGYPKRLYSAVGHPVTWMGKLLERLEARLNNEADADEERRRQGILALALLIAVSVAVASVFNIVVGIGLLGIVLRVLAATTLIAQRSLYEHVRDVADALDANGVEAGRVAVGLIVGRDTEALDEAGISRAAIESLAENFSDGVVAPAFWMAVGGLAGAAAYKATNTADSMIGHMTPRYAAFGWAAACLDDLLNIVPARLSALYIALAAQATGGSFQAAWRTARRDAPGHRSPNAGWPEAAMAGALDLTLGGPRRYGEEVVDGATLGGGNAEADSGDIRAALGLYRVACGIQWLVLAAVWLFIALR